MTALALIRGREYAIVASDGAITEGTSAKLLSLGSKVALMPAISTVIAQRGTDGLANAMLCQFVGVRDFDHLLEHATDGAAAVCHQFKEQMGADARGSMFLIGWSPSREMMESYVIRCRPGEAFTLQPIPEAYCAPMPPQEDLDRCGVSFDCADFNEEINTALRIVCAARLKASPPVDDLPPSHNVGGFLHLTILRRDEIHSSIVHRWPDVIGEKIDPTRGAMMPEFLSGDSAPSDDATIGDFYSRFAAPRVMPAVMVSAKPEQEGDQRDPADNAAEQQK